MRDEPRNQKSRVNRAWNGVITDRDRRYAATDPRQLDLPFPSEADSSTGAAGKKGSSSVNLDRDTINISRRESA
jgi:hypothetical protein